MQLLTQDYRRNDEHNDPALIAKTYPRGIITSGLQTPSRRRSGAPLTTPGLFAAELRHAKRRLALADRLRQSGERMLAAAARTCLGWRENHSEIPAVPRDHTTETAAITGAATRIVIYCEEPILAAGLRELIATDPQFGLIGCCSTLAELKVRFANQRPDMAVIDCTPRITSSTLFELQSLATGCKLILWADEVRSGLGSRALTMGIRGILCKTLPLSSYQECLHRVNSGGYFFERHAPANAH